MFLWLVGFCVFICMFGAHASVYVCRGYHRLTSGVSLHNTLLYLPVPPQRSKQLLQLASGLMQKLETLLKVIRVGEFLARECFNAV